MSPGYGEKVRVKGINASEMKQRRAIAKVYTIIRARKRNDKMLINIPGV